jgi:hypothetical protein
MKKILLSLIIIAASLNAMATDYAVATLTLKGNTSLEQGEVTLVKTDDPAASSYCAPLYIDQYHVVMYAINGTEKYQIWANADLKNFPLGIKTYSDANYTITVSNVSGSETLNLYDAEEDETIVLTAGQSYVFSAAANSMITDRFIINYDPTPDYGSYQRDVTAGNYGTICLPKAGTIAGATLFNIGSYETDMIYIDEVGSAEMEAGKPYIFQASAAQINVTYSSDVEVAAGEDNGLHGYFDANNYFVVPADAGNYILRSNQYWEVVSGQHVAYLNNYFAFIKISEINNQAPAPGRRRVGMAVNGAQVVTGIDELNAAEAPVKTVIDGKMYIIRGEHMFDATGRMVK